jgi:hypothetical protein
MLGGRAPEPGPDAPAGAPRLPGVPRRLRAICTKAMSPLAGDRYPDAGALAADVARFRAGHAVAAYPETIFDRLGRIAATYRTAILLVAAYLIMRLVVALLTG